MKRFSVIVESLILVLCVFLQGKEVTQENWQAGPGVLGPVEDFGSTFYESSGINYLYQARRISLSIVLSSEPQGHYIRDLWSMRDKKIEIANLGGPTGDNDDTSEVPVINQDIIASSLDGVWWYPNFGQGRFLKSYLIYDSGTSMYGYDLADFDSKDGTDIVISDFTTGQIMLFLNDGQGNFSLYSLIAIQKLLNQIAVADFDLDGDVDVVATISHVLTDTTTPAPPCWYENSGDNVHFTAHKLGFDGRAARRINVGDVDIDGDLDFLISGYFPKRQGPYSKGYLGTYWMENRIFESGPDSAFLPHLVDTTRKNLYDWIADVNDDGHPDILTANVDNPFTCTQWYENDNNGNFIPHQLLCGSQEPQNPEGVVSIDIDFDGDMDIIQAFFGEGVSSSQNGWNGWLGWYENDGLENFSYHKFAEYPRACDLQVGDIDGNGYLDLITSTHNPGTTMDWWDLFDRFESTGEITSSIFDAGEPSLWNTITWEADTSTQRKIRVSFQVRTTNDPSNWPDWSRCKKITKTSSLDTLVEQQTRYMQYKVTLTSGKTAYSPMLYKVKIDYGSTSVKENEVVDVVEDIPRLEVSNGTVKYSLARGVRARLYVFDASGRRLEKLEVGGEEGVGILDLGDFGKGVYFVRLETGNSSLVKKVIMLR